VRCKIKRVLDNLLLILLFSLSQGTYAKISWWIEPLGRRKLGTGMNDLIETPDDLYAQFSQGKREAGGYLSQISFLVVDDNEFARKITRDVLKALGARRVKYAEDGAEALEILERIEMDIVVLDWNMPIMDGIELTRSIRNSDDRPNKFMPIIMMTGYSELSNVMYARDAGVTEYLIKPFSAKQFLSRIRSIAENPRSFVRTETFFGPDRRRHRKKTFKGEEKRGEALPAEKKEPEKNDIHKKAIPQKDVDNYFGGANADED